MIKEINIFVDNKPGRLKAITELLTENNINIRALNIQDREDFGLMKLIVDKPDDANLILSENGFASAIKNILAIQLDDTPGGLNNLLGILAENNINIKDSYGFVIESGKTAVLCIEVENVSKSIELIKKSEFLLLGETDIYKL